MSNALMVPSNLLVKSDETEFAKISGSAFLPFIFLQQKSKPNQPDGGHFVLQKGIGGTNLIDLDDTFHCLNFGKRSTAMFIDPVTGKVKSWFGVNKYPEKFAEAELKQSEKGRNGWMFGPQFLLYLPEQNEFATMLFGNKTMRNEAPNMKVLEGKTATIKANFIDDGTNQWWGPLCLPCQVELPRPDDYEEWERVAAGHVEKFQNPPSAVEQAPIEEVEMAGGGRSR